MAMSLVASTGGIALMPLYARNLLPPTVISRPLAGAPPMIDLSLGYNEANTSPLLKTLVSKIEQYVTGNGPVLVLYWFAVGAARSSTPRS